MRPLFSREELEEIRRADAEIDAEPITYEEIQFSRVLDRENKLENMDGITRRIAAYQAEYYAANRERIAAQKAEYRAANRERIAAQKAEYRAANRERNKGRGALIREERINLGLTQKEAGKLAGVSTSLWCRMESGELPAKRENIISALGAIAAAQIMGE